MIIYVLLLILSGWSTYSSVAIPYSIANNFDKNCLQYEEKAVYAEDIESAKDGLTSAINYLDRNGIRGGNNSEYYDLIQGQLEKLEKSSSLNEADQKIVLLEVRDSLGGDYYREKIPSNMSLPAPFGLYLLWFLGSIFALIFSIGFIITAIKSKY